MSIASISRSAEELKSIETESQNEKLLRFCFTEALGWIWIMALL